MTGIYNRRHFMMLADREWNRSRRYGRHCHS
jgi:PleD family two-component response regulator